MADTVTSQILLDGSKKVVVLLTGSSDGSGESAVVKVDVSALTPAATTVRVDKITYDVNGEMITLAWDADTDVPFARLTTGQGIIDAAHFGGIRNNAGT